MALSREFREVKVGAQVGSFGGFSPGKKKKKKGIGQESNFGFTQQVLNCFCGSIKGFSSPFFFWESPSIGV